MKTSLAVFALLLWSSVARAGSFTQTGDASSILTSDDLSQLRQEFVTWPIDIRVLVERAGDLQTLQRDAHDAVVTPNVVVIAIDPSAGRVVTRFGRNTGIRSGDFDAISKAGNASFHNHAWRQGIEAIAARAQASATPQVVQVPVQVPMQVPATNQPVIVQVPVAAPPVQHGMSGGDIFLTLLLVGGCAGLVFWLFRRARKEREDFQNALDENRLETAELRSRNVESMTMPEDPAPVRTAPTPRRAPPAPSGTVAASYHQDARRPVPPPAPVNIYNSTSGYGPPARSDGFVEGMLMGELLSQPRVVERDVIVERERPTTRQRVSRDYDEGGSSSNFDPAPTYTSNDDNDSGGSDSVFSTDTGGGDSTFTDSGSSDSGGSNDGGGGDSSF
jgi:hypothetical protein